MVASRNSLKFSDGPCRERPKRCKRRQYRVEWRRRHVLLEKFGIFCLLGFAGYRRSRMQRREVQSERSKLKNEPN